MCVCAVVREFCRISVEFIRKGANPRVYQSAARESTIMMDNVCTSKCGPINSSRETQCGCLHCGTWRGGSHVPADRVLQANGKSRRTLALLISTHPTPQVVLTYLGLVTHHSGTPTPGTRTSLYKGSFAGPTCTLLVQINPWDKATPL